MRFNPNNMLVIDLGALGEAISSLPALRALRRHFPNTKITVAANTTGAEIIRLSGYVDEIIHIKRRSQNTSPVATGLRLIKLAKQLRQRKFDFVIDLNSSQETNLMTWITGSKNRLAARRPGNPLDFLINIKAPTRVSGKYADERNLDVLLPLGITNVNTDFSLPTNAISDKKIDQLLTKAGLKPGELVIGLDFPQSSIGPFAELASLLVQNFNAKAILLTDPEMGSPAKEIASRMPKGKLIALDKLNMSELISATARCTLLVTAGSGIMQIGSAVGVPTLAVLDSSVSGSAEPRGGHSRALRYSDFNSIDVTEVYSTACEMLGKSRTSQLFQR